MFPVAAKKRVLASLLAVALLLCHGVFGVHHLIPSPPIFAGSAEGHTSAAGHDVPTHERSADHSMSAGYFATLLAVALGTLLWLLLRNARAWSRIIAPDPHFARPLARIFLHRPRGPSPPMLQVFRL